MKFECTRCGKCCNSMGRHIRVERKMGERDFYCREMVSGSFFVAHIEPSAFAAFSKKGDSGQDETSCIFQVPDAQGYSCAIYATRPVTCRNFRCCRMRIFDRHGVIAGTVKGRRSFSPISPELEKLWNEHVRPIQADDDKEWDRNVQEVLLASGYSVEIFDS